MVSIFLLTMFPPDNMQIFVLVIKNPDNMPVAKSYGKSGNADHIPNSYREKIPRAIIKS